MTSGRVARERCVPRATCVRLDPILPTDSQRALQLRGLYPGGEGIFIRPPSFEEL